MPWVTRYHRYDGQGNTRLLTDETGTATDSFNFDAWGNEITRTGTTKTPFRWNGRVGYYWDEDSGTYQVRRRPYSPKIGRWFTVDPIWPRDGMNPFIYALNSPQVYLDSSGKVIARAATGSELGENGKFTLQWTFRINPPKEVLVVVQLVFITFNIQNCQKKTKRTLSLEQKFYEIIGFVDVDATDISAPGVLENVQAVARASNMNKDRNSFRLPDVPQVSNPFVHDTWTFSGCSLPTQGNFGIQFKAQLRAFPITDATRKLLFQWVAGAGKARREGLADICQQKKSEFTGAGGFVSHEFDSDRTSRRWWDGTLEKTPIIDKEEEPQKALVEWCCPHGKNNTREPFNNTVLLICDPMSGGCGD